MTDLVERLRLIADDPWPDEWHREAALEALAEIERLRAIVAGVPPRHKAERVMDDLNHHALDENQRLAARVEEMEGKYAALKETLDPNSIGFSMAVMIAEAEEKADSLRARVEELEAEVARANVVEEMWRAECLKAQQMLVEERARVAELEAQLEEGRKLRNGMIAIEPVQQSFSEFRTRVAELEKDAARYRHMKSNATFQNRNGPGLYWYLPRYNLELPIGERLDAAIDAAMREGNG